MHRTPTRRSARLMSVTNNMDNNAGLSPILETPPIQPETAVSTNSQLTISSVNSEPPVTVQTHVDDETTIVSASQTIVTTGSVLTPSHAQQNFGGHNYDEIEKRIAMLELHLKATQVQLRERDNQNEALRSALLSNGSSAVTYASSVVSQSQRILPQSTQTPLIPSQSAQTPSMQSQAAQTQIQPSPMPSNIQSNASTPFIECPRMPLSTSMNFYSFSQPNTFSSGSRYTPALHSSNLFLTHESGAPTSTSQASQPCAGLQYIPYNLNIPRKLLDLPEFSGRAEDWPMFYASFVESTAAYRYSNFDNNQRLQKCLKGDARETVKSLLIHPNNVSCIIEQLKFRFGRPEQLVRSQIAQVREIAPISESMLGKLISFATKVKNICALLESAGDEHHIANPMLLDELIAKLPMNKRIEWGRYATTLSTRGTVSHFSDWLTALANVICTVNDECQLAGRELKRRTVLHVDDTNSRRCPICQGQHKAADCKRLLEATVADRWTQIKSLRLCFACLNGGHITSNCRRRKVCGIDGCGRAHHKLLHESRSVRPPVSSTSSSRSSSNVTSRSASPSDNANKQQQPRGDQGATVLSCSTSSPKEKLLYRILPVTLYGRERRVDTFALLDEGSSITMMDSSLAKELNLQGRPYSLNVQWFGGHSVREPATLVDLHISGAGIRKRHKLQRVHAVQSLKLPTQSLSRSDLELDDQEAHQLPVQPHAGATPRLLIGIDNCHLGLASTTITMRKHGPFAAKTELGWVVFGPVGRSQSPIATCLFLKTSPNESLHDMVANFFETESFGVRPSPPIESKDDIRARAILESTTRRVGNRFQTGLIWKDDNIQLPNSYDMAAKRLRSVEKRMSCDDIFATAYREIIHSYVAKGYARKLTSSESAQQSPRTWYLPHFAVVNPNKPGKLRFVFDAAAQVNGISLNSCLLKGPQDYRPLPSILFRFRERAVGLCGDIKEMFHQVLIRPEDRCSQRFLWRNGDSSQTPDVYEMCVMIFGAACSPCAAQYIKTRNALEHEADDRYTTRAITAILENHYVDDLVDSFGSAREAIAVATEVRDIHRDAGFELRNFSSNSAEVITALDGADIEKVIGVKESPCAERVLGLHWHSATDCFRFTLKFNKVSEAVISGSRCPTKRELLSVVMSIFDPLGLLAHFVVGAKLIMREVWRHETSWDEPLPSKIAASWERWRKQLAAVVDYACPRFYFRNGAPETLQLHVFVDASEDAFSAVAYWRAKNSRGEIEVAFICAKSKCAPIKTLTIPRLELQAAVLGVRLQQAVREAHSLKVDKCILWSDSGTVIKWIRSQHRKYKPFVQHRIAEIVAATDESDWRWIPTGQNVADEATRANHNTVFGPTTRWVQGPSFLREEEHAWPTEGPITVETPCDEELQPRHALIVVRKDFIDFNRFSSHNRLLRTTAWVILFVKICRRKKTTNPYGLDADDLQSAKLFLCRLVQEGCFSEEIQQIQDGQNISSKSSLVQLSPYLDEDGVLRVRGRIDAASFLPVRTRRPIILPPTHVYTKLLTEHHHIRMGHQNDEATICAIRQEYWVPRLRTLLRNVIANCNVCRLRKAEPVPPLMGPLPVDRLTPYVRPFTYTGMDYFGPLSVTVRRSTEKRWVALFTCLTTRAVHLEVAHDLSTDSCIIVIRNFINRRGVPARLRSDNGKNFVGVNNEATRFTEEFDCERVQGELSQRGIDWVFNSPLTQLKVAFGKGWCSASSECCAKRLKKLLHVSIRCIVEAENIVNSRPLTHLPISPNQEQPLTPNDFLLGTANTASTPSVNGVPDDYFTLRQQWRMARQLRDHLWKRWVLEYLPTLTRRAKWCQPTKPIKEGELVFLCDPNVPRRQWCRGMVERLYPSKDGVVRQADVRTNSGIKRRAVSKLAVLDVESGEWSDSRGRGCHRTPCTE